MSEHPYPAFKKSPAIDPVLYATLSGAAIVDHDPALMLTPLLTLTSSHLVETMQHLIPSAFLVIGV
jgi:hypothetical protein